MQRKPDAARGVQDHRTGLGCIRASTAHAFEEVDRSVFDLSVCETFDSHRVDP